MRSKPVMPRLLRNIRINDAGCWEWQGSLTKAGYGTLSVSNKLQYVHRISYLVHKGPIPDGRYICHTCDVPRCVNPEHLFAGTPTDNVIDMRSKHRAVDVRGERVGTAKLTEEQVRQIRAEPLTLSAKKVGAKYGVSDNLVCRIRNRKIWRHV